MARLRRYAARRLLMAPLMPVLAVVALVAVAVSIPVSALVCPVLAVAHGSRPRWRVLRVTVMALVYLLGEVVAIVVCLLLWVATGLGWKLRAPWSERAHRAVLTAFLGTALGASRWLFGFRVALEEPVGRPAELSRAFSPEPILVLARHAGPGASFALVHELLVRYQRNVRVVLKAQLRLDPAIDLLLTRTGAAWIDNGRDAVGAAERVGEVAAGLRARDALLLFPEGADWTPVRHLQAVARLRRKGLFREARLALRMPHVLPPRPAGTVAALRAAPGSDVLIFTHTGMDDLLDAASSWAAIPLSAPLRMSWWRADPAELRGVDDDEITGWLQRTWIDIDAWIEERQQLIELGVPTS